MYKKVIVLFDPEKKQILEVLQEVRPWLESVSEVNGWYQHVDEIDNKIIASSDLLLVFGGDGLLLSVARRLAGAVIPVVGINLGKLGFLAELEISEIHELIPAILRGECKVVSRMMLLCEVFREGSNAYSMLGLNDAVVKCASASRMLYTSLNIDQEHITSFGGDGIIVATPVGSTAYSLSAGGPVLSPTVPAFIITPICPHMLTLRPLVISSSHTVQISLLSPYPGDAILTLDGQINFPLQHGDHIHISQSDKHFYLIQTGKRSFFRVLQEKLVWGEARLNWKHY